MKNTFESLMQDLFNAFYCHNHIIILMHKRRGKLVARRLVAKTLIILEEKDIKENSKEKC